MSWKNELKTIRDGAAVLLMRYGDGRGGQDKPSQLFTFKNIDDALVYIVVLAKKGEIGAGISLRSIKDGKVSTVRVTYNVIKSLEYAYRQTKKGQKFIKVLESSLEKPENALNKTERRLIGLTATVDRGRLYRPDWAERPDRNARGRAHNPSRPTYREAPKPSEWAVVITEHGECGGEIISAEIQTFQGLKAATEAFKAVDEEDMTNFATVDLHEVTDGQGQFLERRELGGEY